MSVPPAAGSPSGERGAVLVEFALISPLLLALICGIIDFGLITSQAISIRQGVREAARQAAVGEVGTNDCSGDIYGSIPGTGAQALVCRAKERIGLDPASIRIRIEIQDTDGDGMAYETGSALVVCAMYPRESVTGLFTSILGNSVMTAEVQMRIDDDDISPPLGTAGETALPGGSWGFCEPY